MWKFFSCLLLVMNHYDFLSAQQSRIDSLKTALKSAKEDVNKENASVFGKATM